MHVHWYHWKMPLHRRVGIVYAHASHTQPWNWTDFMDTLQSEYVESRPWTRWWGIIIAILDRVEQLVWILSASHRINSYIVHYCVHNVTYQQTTYCIFYAGVKIVVVPR